MNHDDFNAALGEAVRTHEHACKEMLDDTALKCRGMFDRTAEQCRSLLEHAEAESLKMVDGAAQQAREIMDTELRKRRWQHRVLFVAWGLGCFYWGFLLAGHR